MSTGLECKFIKLTTTGEWWYLLENWDSPKGAMDWREYANAYGPFVSYEAADQHLCDHHANPGGSWTDDAYTPDEVVERLILEAKERKQAEAGAERRERRTRWYGYGRIHF